MTPENFCYWLQGILEIQTAGKDANEKVVAKLNESQIEMIQDHLNLVMGKPHRVGERLQIKKPERYCAASELASMQARLKDSPAGSPGDDLTILGAKC